MIAHEPIHYALTDLGADPDGESHPVDSGGITTGQGIPDADLDKLIAATAPTADHGDRSVVTITHLEARCRAVVGVDQVADTILSLYPEAPAEVIDAIDQLQAALVASQRNTTVAYYGELASYLGLVVEPGDPYNYRERAAAEDADEVEH